MSEIRIVRDYPYPVTRLWRALTDPDLIPLWTVTGAGGRPEGFAPVPGTKFRFVAKPKPGWNGIVNCEVLEAREPVLLRYTWTDGGGGDTTEVTYRLEPCLAPGLEPAGGRPGLEPAGCRSLAGRKESCADLGVEGVVALEPFRRPGRAPEREHLLCAGDALHARHTRTAAATMRS